MKIRVQYSTSPFERDAYIFQQVEDYWVGVGQTRKNEEKFRRFLRVRSASGISTYFYWSPPNKGDISVIVHHFKKMVKITKQQAIRHYDQKRR